VHKLENPVTAALASHPSLPKSGDLIANKYRVERMIGAGGMGAVYVAVHELLREKVAIKVLLPEVVSDRDAVTRFLNEARNATRIRNEHVAQVKDVDTLPTGVPYMIMEYLDGHDLGQCQKVWGPVPIAPAVDYILQALEALADAHAIGVIHRDLKPANLFLGKDPDGTDCVKVLDFGISKSTDLTTPLADHGGVTTTKAVLGSPGYMSPEQIKNAKHVDARADIWSMGVILYKLITNHKPFNGDTMGEVFAAIFEETPRPLRSYRPDVPPALEEIVIGRCLQRDRDKRFRNVSELAAALGPYGLPTSGASVERIRRRLAASGASTSTLSHNIPQGMGGATDQSASVSRSHVSQVSQSHASQSMASQSQASQSMASQSQASSSHSYPSGPSYSYQSMQSQSVSFASGSEVPKSKTALFVVAGVLVAILLGCVVIGIKLATEKPDKPVVTATTTTTTAATPTNTQAPRPTNTPAAATTDNAVPIDKLPAPPATTTAAVTTTTPAPTSTPAMTSTSGGSRPKASSAPSDDILKMRR